MSRFRIDKWADVESLLSYCSDTGDFTWRVIRGGAAQSGRLAGTLTPFGYRRIKIGHRSYFAHRLAWLHSYGHWPVDQIDHINGLRDDNRIINLRSVSRVVNMQNQRRAHVDNLSSGLLGVSWSKNANQWGAGIRLNGRRQHIGYFPTAASAHEAYLAVKRRSHEGCSI